MMRSFRKSRSVPRSEREMSPIPRRNLEFRSTRQNLFEQQDSNSSSSRDDLSSLNAEINTEEARGKLFGDSLHKAVAMHSRLIDDILHNRLGKAKEKLNQITPALVNACRDNEKESLMKEIKSLIASEMRPYEMSLNSFHSNRLEVVHSKDNLILPYNSSMNMHVNDRAMEKAIERHRSFMIPLLKGGKLRELDASTLILLDKTNCVAQEFKLSEEQHRSLLAINLPEGPLKKLVSNSQHESMHALYYRLQVTNPALDSIKTSRDKLIHWHLQPGKQLGPSLDSLQNLLATCRPDLLNKENYGEFITQFLSKVEGSVFGNFRQQITSLILESKSTRNPKPLSYYLSKVVFFGESAPSNEFYQNKSKFSLSRACEVGYEDDDSDAESEDEYYDSFSINQYCPLHQSSSHAQDECRKLRNLPPDELRKYDLLVNKDLHSKSFPVKHFPVHMDGKQNKLSKEIEYFFANRCYRCGRSNHTSANCLIYADAPQAHSLCEKCLQGFHTICKQNPAVKKSEFRKPFQKENTENPQYNRGSVDSNSRYQTNESRQSFASQGKPTERKVMTVEFNPTIPQYQPPFMYSQFPPFFPMPFPFMPQQSEPVQAEVDPAEENFLE